MEGQSRSGSRRARFVEDDRLRSDSSGNDGTFQSATTVPVHAVLHDALPDLGSVESRPGIAEPSTTLANLTDEFNDLSRKMTLLKETLKVTRGHAAPRRTAPARTSSSCQANQVAELSDILVAKRIVLDCISELTFVNHFLDGNEVTASHYRDKLRDAFSGGRGKPEAIVIQGLSVSPTSFNTTVRGENLVADSAVGGAERSPNRHGREAEVQTEFSETSMDRNVPKSHASLKIIDEVRQKPEQRDGGKKTKKWYSCCAIGDRRKKKANEKRDEKSNEASSSKKSMVKPREKSSGVVRDGGS